MVDLAQGTLPHAIRAGDGWAEVLTGFRTWLMFGRVLGKARVWWPGIFPGAEPDGDWHEAALEFYESPVETPRTATGGVRTLDLDLDGDYVVGSFQSAYGIDLTDPALDMHWHRFRALLRSLPEDSMVSRIASWRAWDASEAHRRPDDAARARRDAWALPIVAGDDREAAVERQRRVFGAAVERFEMEVASDG